MSEASSDFAGRLKEAFIRAGVENKALHEELKGKLDQSGADKLYLGISAKAASASHADTAVSAVNTVSATVAESASQADKLSTARTINLTGDVSGSGEFDGTVNLSLSTILADSGVTAGSYGPGADAAPGSGGSFVVPQVVVDAKGRVTSVSSRKITIPSSVNYAVTAGTANSVDVSRVKNLAVGALTWTKAASANGTTYTVAVSRDAYGRLSGLNVTSTNCNCNCNCNCDCADSDTDG